MIPSRRHYSLMKTRDEHVRPTLVVVAADDPDALVSEAAAYATSTGAPLVVLSVMATAEFEARYRARQSLPGEFPYSLDAAAEDRRRAAVRAGRAALEGSDTPVEGVGVVGDAADCTLRVAREYDADHVVVADTGRRRWRDLLLGRRGDADAIRRAFPGTVTVVSGDAPVAWSYRRTEPVESTRDDPLEAPRPRGR